ncbi:LysR family transcriptional regulator [Frankia sp. Cr1]|uniref:LysR family transcriptional regulator n=1 Tax=Frankia sp. Cr1 TaxID=3073931 RepID=UPI002AD47BB5|nr:LysR family transcriptional regulator [Frankia sp. Cr1]
MDEPRFSLRQLQYFVAAAEAGTISGAAARMRVSATGVSLAITELERALGTQLVLRRPARGLALTVAGNHVLVEARALLGAAGELQSGVHDLGQELVGRLVVGCYSPLAPLVLPPLLEGFQAAHPGVDLDFVEGSLTELQGLLAAGDCEVALMYDQDIVPGTTTEVLYRARPHVVLPAGHRLSGLEQVDLAELAGEPLVMLDIPPSVHHTTMVFESAGLTPRVRYRSRNVELVRSLVGRGLGYSLLIQRPRTDVTYDGRRVVTRPIESGPGEVAVVLARPTRARATRRVQAFVRFCHAALAAKPGETPPAA